jgi:hypothetical protein
MLIHPRLLRRSRCGLVLLPDLRRDHDELPGRALEIAAGVLATWRHALVALEKHKSAWRLLLDLAEEDPGSFLIVRTIRNIAACDDKEGTANQNVQFRELLLQNTNFFVAPL